MFTFSDALVMLRESAKVRRKDWPDRDYVYLHVVEPIGESFIYYSNRRNARGLTPITMWVPTQYDLLDKDWEILKPS